MSHFSKVKTQMTDEGAILAALRELGYSFQVHEKPVCLNNNFSGARRQGMKAHIVVSLPGTDFGLLKTKDGYAVITDTYFMEALTLSQRLPMEYSKQVIIRQAALLGDEYTVAERVENGVLLGYQIAVEKAPELMAGQSTLTNSRLLVGY